MDLNKKPTRGGARPGAGRKPSGAALITASIRVREQHIDLMLEAGDGNASLGLRKLLDELVLRRTYGNPGTKSVSLPSAAPGVKKKVLPAAPRVPRN